MISIIYRPLQQLLTISSEIIDKHSFAHQKMILRDYRHQILAQHCPNLVIGKLAEGKPVAISHPEFVFNHSHSQHFYALAWSQSVKDLGVDIEDLDRNVRMFALAKRSFHPDEFQMWQELDYCREFWFKVWTIKEAVLKAHGMGIRIDLHSLNTKAHPHWDFGRVSHLVLGEFFYQNLRLSQSMLSVAYRADGLKLSPLALNL